jgi:hypothetical protein
MSKLFGFNHPYEEAQMKDFVEKVQLQNQEDFKTED